ncbi:Prolyl 4-hydroxylase subunit alpha-2 [Thelohanellus kitauei]|uniref:procollagen-proline 4-dioxygenase n=1 Tax=Thelohanellus kitauei TaxID=669202 RepID=A0A0C2NFB7_THEKT|nr:Prolyl 4-hydroxylase subunit alpha-2 [Thelohanellus kitauei]
MGILRSFLLIKCLFDLIWLTHQEIYTSTLQICHIFKLELDELRYFDQKFNEIDYTGHVYDLIQEIRKEVPREIFNDITYSLNDCVYEHSFLNLFITHPINSLALIKRFITKWPQVQNSSLFPEHRELSVFVKKYNFNNDDLVGAYEALYRLQKFNWLDPAKLQNGTLWKEWDSLSKYSVIIPRSLTPKDMYQIGVMAYGDKDFESAKSWFSASYEEIKANNTQVSQRLLINVVDYLSWAEYKLGEFDLAFDHAHQLIRIDPTNERWVENLQSFKEKMTENAPKSPKSNEYFIKSLKSERFRQRIKRILNNHSYENLEGDYEVELSRQICRDDKLWKTEVSKLLIPVCFVIKGSNTFGKFITVKVERISSDPDIYMFRSIADQYDVWYWKMVTRFYLESSIVFNAATGKQEPAKYRISKGAWVDLDYNSLMVSLVNRLRVATAITFDSAEMFQVVNYGLGGYYDIHYDFSRKNVPSNNDGFSAYNGKRLATFMLYLSDVAIGGHTAFPRLGLSVKPSKGDVLFWHNLLSDETGDARMHTIDCPVVQGSKWVGTFWVRSRGQERTRPCSLYERGGI